MGACQPTETAVTSAASAAVGGGTGRGGRVAAACSTGARRRGPNPPTGAVWEESALARVGGLPRHAAARGGRPPARRPRPPWEAPQGMGGTAAAPAWGMHRGGCRPYRRPVVGGPSDGGAVAPPVPSKLAVACAGAGKRVDIAVHFGCGLPGGGTARTSGRGAGARAGRRRRPCAVCRGVSRWRAAAVLAGETAVDGGGTVRDARLVLGGGCSHDGSAGRADDEVGVSAPAVVVWLLEAWRLAGCRQLGVFQELRRRPAPSHPYAQYPPFLWWRRPVALRPCSRG